MTDLYIEPLTDSVLVKPDIEEVTSPSGIVLTTNNKLARAQRQLGTIVAIGPLAWYKYIDDFGGYPVKIGDKVMYTQYAGAEVEDPVTEEMYTLLFDTDILFKVKTNE